ncbi:MAG: ABC transporter substrate-binding protein, partial [Clostridiales bacterium]|nr:ABC transporter substrate-binding protein [Clostridiales bacterium]
MRKKVISMLLAVFMITALMAGCSSKEEDAAPAETKQAGTAASEGATEEETDAEGKDSVIVAMGPSSEPESGFDPAYGWGAGEHVHEPLIQSTLTVTTTDLKIDYDLATDVQQSEDGMTWTVTIRDDVKFTDGEPLTASDVAFTYNTVKEISSVNDFT